MKLYTVESLRRLDEGLRNIDGIGPLHINLEKVWKACQQQHPFCGRLFTSVLDMQLHVVRLNVEINAIAQRINADLHESRDADCLTDDGELAARLDLFGNTTAFVLRYRAIWDKLMGVVVLLLDPKKYKRFVKAKSRKKAFVKLLKARGANWPNYAQSVSETIEIFDSRFRTAEAHGSGRMRKLVFSRVSDDANPLDDLFWACNSLNIQLLALQQIFDHLAEPAN